MASPECGVVVGCGSIGKRHIRNAAELGVGELIGIDKRASARIAALDAGASDVYANIGDAFRKHSVQFGIVAVPNHLHVSVARELARNRVDILIEKPLSDTNKHIRGLKRMANRFGLVTLVGYNFRFHPGIRKLRDLLREEVIGQPLSVKIEAGSYLPDWHPQENYQEMYSAKAEMGGGVVLDSIHELNYCRWLFGEVNTVMAMTSSKSHLQLETEDVGAMILEMSDGTLCEVHVDYVQQSPSRTGKVVGDEGTLCWNLNDPLIRQYEPTSDEWINHVLPEWTVDDMYVDELEHFFSRLDSRSATICPINEGHKDLQVALAALKSAEVGSRVAVK
jgi:predicted dehydrogenase